MDQAHASAAALRLQIAATEIELIKLKAQLAQVEATEHLEKLSIEDSGLVTKHEEREWPLLAEEYRRYGRQMIVPSVGIQGISCFTFCSRIGCDLFE
jgi:adenylyltransferase/sulfurtransferase